MNPDDLADTLISDPQSPTLDDGPADGGVEPGPLTEAPPPSIRDTLAKNFKADAVETPEPTAAVKAAENAAGRVYDKATGRFIADPSKSAAAPKPAAAQPTVSPTTTEAKPADGTQSNAPAGPPPGWSPESKALFAKLPPSIQADVIKREAEVDAGFKQYQGLKQRADEFERVIAPNRHIYASEGVSDAQAVHNIWQWFHALKNDPERAFPALAEMLGFDPSTVDTDAGQDPSQGNLDPRIAAEIRALKQEIGGISGTLQQQRFVALNERLSEWGKSRPHYQTVKVDMGRLMQAGLVPMGDLETAYAKATALHGLHSSPVTDTPRPASPAVDPAARSRAARHAAVSPRPSGPNGAAPGKAKGGGSVRDSLKGAIDQLSSD
jgi:hypothetical protein